MDHRRQRRDRAATACAAGWHLVLFARSSRLPDLADELGESATAQAVAAKHALVGIAEKPSLELLGTGVGVTLLNPGPVETGLGRGGPSCSSGPALSSTDVARAVLASLNQPPGMDVNEILLRPHGATP